MTALAKKKLETIEPALPIPASDTAAIMAMIERMSRQPEIPVERVQQLFALYQQIQADQARRAYYAAFAQMQPELPIINKKGKSHQAKYALWEDIVSDITPVTAKHGFALSFRTLVKDGKITVTGILSHRDGHTEDTSLELPADTTGSKNAIQAIGSTTSYGKRYTACALLNVVARGEDNDGQSAADTTPVSGKQAEELMRLVTETKTDILKFLEVAGAESISDIMASKFDRLKALLIAKKRKAAQ